MALPGNSDDIQNENCGLYDIIIKQAFDYPREGDAMEKMKLPHDHGQITTSILERMPDYESFDETSAIFQQVCDTSRLRIFWLLCYCEECGINIAAAVDMSTAAVSHHLKTLKLHGLITSKRQGKEVYYTIANTETARLIHKAIDDLLQITSAGKGATEHITE